MRPATDPADAGDLVALRARRAGLGLTDVLTDVDVVGAFLAALVVVDLRVTDFFAGAFATAFAAAFATAFLLAGAFVVAALAATARFLAAGLVVA